MIKSRAAKGKARVTFTVDPGVGAQAAAVCGEWNGWSAGAGVMHRDADGGFSVTAVLDAGRAYRFRYLLDGQRWDNDWAADAYVANDFGGEDSVVDLTALAEAVPPAARKTKKAAAREAPAQAAKKAAPTAKRAREDSEIARARPGRCRSLDRVPAPRNFPLRIFRETAVLVVMVAPECAPTAQAGIPDGAGHRAVVLVPGRFPPAHAERHAARPLLGLARPARREHLRPHPPQIGRARR